MHFISSSVQDFPISEEVPTKRTRHDDEEEDRKQDYEEWKRKILENAAKAQANGTS